MHVTESGTRKRIRKEKQIETFFSSFVWHFHLFLLRIARFSSTLSECLFSISWFFSVFYSATYAKFLFPITSSLDRYLIHLIQSQGNAWTMYIQSSFGDETSDFSIFFAHTHTHIVWYDFVDETKNMRWWRISAEGNGVFIVNAIFFFLLFAFFCVWFVEWEEKKKKNLFTSFMIRYVSA